MKKDSNSSERVDDNSVDKRREKMNADFFDYLLQGLLQDLRETWYDGAVQLTFARGNVVGVCRAPRPTRVGHTA